MNTLIILSPLILFVIIVVLIFFSIGKFSLREAITETYSPTEVKENSLYKTENIENLLKIKPDNTGVATSISKIYPPTIQTSTEKSKISISRLIALISSILTIIIVLMICCLFTYCYLNCKPFPDMSKLIEVFVALGIGVVPYSFNKVSTAIGAKKNDPSQTNLQ